MKINENQKINNSYFEPILAPKLPLLGTKFGTKTASKTIKNNDQKKKRKKSEKGRPRALKPEQLKTESAE